MPFNIYQPRGRTRFWLLLSLCGTTMRPLAGQVPCPPQAGAEVIAGWRAYRADSIEVAQQLFSRADRRCGNNLDAKTGLGYAALRRGWIGRADSLFHLILEQDSTNGDAWLGLAFGAQRQGRLESAAAAAHQVLRLNPSDQTARTLLDQLTPDWDRKIAPRDRPRQLAVHARVRGTRFEVLSNGRWKEFYIKGINLGAALPGKFPSEFPQDSALYARWLEQMAGMNANTVRLYTILPPQFYRALRAWNLTHPQAALWLIHGVWTELPPHDNFNDPAWKQEFRLEMQRVVDLLHGNIRLPPRRGHASGLYDADVSPWALAYIIGREWEPYAVKAFDQINLTRAAYRGRFLESDSVPASDYWMAEQSDFLLAYSVNQYNTLRPVAYTNWPTLDPLFHPTEATTEEESEWRRRAGRPASLVREYENDAIGLDPSLIRPTAQNPAGWFASYHAYPYYPDFILLDATYASARSSEGPSNYFGYLQALVRHHHDVPVLIAEYGVPSSRGLAHLQPQDWHHGGHDENDMARIDARLTREIQESGAAGGILFAWIDEWFKKNWVVVDLEIPQENTRQWHNVMDAEQNYGVVGMYAGDSALTPRLGGNPDPWRRGTELAVARESAGLLPGSLRVQADESYVYLAVTLARPGPFPWDSLGVMIALDVLLPERGQHRLPDSLVTSDLGFEFLVDLRDTSDAEIRVTPDYNPYGAAPDASGDDVGRFYQRPATIRDRHDGRFDSLYVGTNRAKYGRDGTFYPARGVNRGRLRYGKEATSTLADWYYDAAHALLEVRIPWGLVNVTDPSTRTILYETAADDKFGTAPAQGFHIGVLTYRKGTGTSLVGALPLVRAESRWTRNDFRRWEWEPWDTPRWHSRTKPVYDSMRTVWGRLP